MGDAWADAPVDAALIVEPILDDGVGVDPAAFDAWVARLEAMYRGWAERRHMQLETIAPPANRSGPTILRITGFGAFRTLAPERGLHVLEQGKDRSTVRTVARVRVAAGPREDPLPAHLHNALHTLIEATGESGTVTRRYRETPSPLVRDAAAGWRSGRLDAVLAGDFDLIGLLSD
jgi:ATP-dependent Clp protease ATP-binding subunit ClpC